MNLNKNSIVIGCNYHTKWQMHPGMRFKLLDVHGPKALLVTRTTDKKFWTDTNSLIFIMSQHNIDKANKLIKKHKEQHEYD